MGAEIDNAEIDNAEIDDVSNKPLVIDGFLH